MLENYPFKPQPLPYSYNALEPYIDAKTMELHHDKHLVTYVNNLNHALAPYPEYYTWSLEKLLYHIDALPPTIQTAVKNNAGGVYNHNFFFQGLTPNSQLPISGPLFNAIVHTFGSMESFKQEMKRIGLEVFGSGWALLTADHMGRLGIIKLANQETQIPFHLTPILILDVWEHAYYLKNQNRRAEYIDNWWKAINWQQAELNYLNR